MSYDPKREAVTVVQYAFQDILDLVDLTSKPTDDSGEYCPRSEAEETIVALVSSVLMRDHGVREDEISFCESLFSWNRDRQSSQRILVDYAERWAVLSQKVPRFFESAVAFDLVHDTTHANAMLRHIQMIGNNTAISDVILGRGESKVVREYLRRLETYAEYTRNTAI